MTTAVDRIPLPRGDSTARDLVHELKALHDNGTTKPTRLTPSSNQSSTSGSSWPAPKANGQHIS
eukprot:5672235-Amphidinium_carterae.1